MASLIAELRDKVRALIEDFLKTSSGETFTYTTGDQVFTLQEENIQSVISVTKNGEALGSGEYSFDNSSNELTISASLSSGDIIIVKYTYYKYSDTEIDGHIKSAIVWISVSSYCETDYEMDSDGDIYPTPNNKEEDLFAVIASIIIKPNYTEYRLPNLTVRYPRTMDKETKIQKLIEKFYIGLGINDVLEFD